MTALDDALDLFDAARGTAAPDVARGYADLLGGDDPTGRLVGQQLMASRIIPLIYERLWRPLGGRLLMGASMDQEREAALEMLALRPADRILDVGCGPGNFARTFAAAAPDGLVVGADASRTMLDRAVRERNPSNVAYVRCDAAALPFADAAFDAVCCFAALYFIEDPYGALDEIARVLAPGGRVAVLTSVNRGLLPTPLSNAVVRPLTGVRMFGRDEMTAALRDRGLEVTGRRLSGLAQFVSARRD